MKSSTLENWKKGALKEIERAMNLENTDSKIDLIWEQEGLINSKKYEIRNIPVFSLPKLKNKISKMSTCIETKKVPRKKAKKPPKTRTRRITRQVSYYNPYSPLKPKLNVLKKKTIDYIPILDAYLVEEKMMLKDNRKKELKRVVKVREENSWIAKKIEEIERRFNDLTPLKIGGEFYLYPSMEDDEPFVHLFNYEKDLHLVLPTTDLDFICHFGKVFRIGLCGNIDQSIVVFHNRRYGIVGMTTPIVYISDLDGGASTGFRGVHTKEELAKKWLGHWIERFEELHREGVFDSYRFCL